MTKHTIFTAYNQTKKILKAAGIEDYSCDARYILRHVTGLSNAQILTKYNEELTPLQQTVLNNMVNRRAKRYPLQYILGVWQFYGLDFLVGEGVLVPRADTEVLVETCLELLEDKPSKKVLDLCAGSGCIGIAIAKNSDSDVICLEKYDEAYEYLQKNAKKHENCVKTVKADVFTFNTEEKFDLIVSNPPYISEEELALMNKETEFEPREALFAEENGLIFYKKIIRDYKQFLNHGGILAFEIGFSLGVAVKALMLEAGYKNVTCRNDFGGNERVVFGTVD